MSDSKKSFFEFLKSLNSVVGDLSSISAPSFLLNGNSMVEYSKYWMDYPELILQMNEEENEEKRMVLICKWYISTLFGSYASRGPEKKPYNPILREKFIANSGKCLLTSEQVSHHPPITAFHIKCLDVEIHGHIQPTTTFKGTYVEIIPQGRVTVRIKDDIYLVSLPHLAMRGLLQVSPYFEMMDHVYIVAKSGYMADFEFILKGYFRGEYNMFKASIYGPSENNLTTITGNWDGQSFIKQFNEKEEVLIDILATKRTECIPVVSNDPKLSMNVWGEANAALQVKNYSKVTELKNKIESDQRLLKKDNIGKNIEYKPDLFHFEEDKGTDLEELVFKLKSFYKSNTLSNGSYVLNK